MNKKITKPKDVDTYIANSALGAYTILKEIRGIMKSVIPGVEEGISWGVPFYMFHGGLAGFATYKGHVSIGFIDEINRKDREALENKGYTTGLKTMQIKFGQKVPSSSIKKLLKEKAKLNETKDHR
jgi:uncharacterized protein